MLYIRPNECCDRIEQHESPKIVPFLLTKSFFCVYRILKGFIENVLETALTLYIEFVPQRNRYRMEMVFLRSKASLSS